MASEQTAPRKPLHLLIVSNTESLSSIHGADRDWVNLLNALGPERVRVTWAGVKFTESLRDHLDQRLDVRFVNLHVDPFYELFHRSMYRRRSAFAWTRITVGSARALRRPLGILRQALRNDRPDVVITNTSVMLAGAAFAKLARLPHIWCVKEFLDPSVADCRRYARLIENFSDLVVVPSTAMAQAFSRRVRVLHDGNDTESIRQSTAAVDTEKVLEALGLPTSQPVMAQIGALSWAKGQSITAQACVQLAREGVGPCSILFLGPGAVSEKEQLRGIFSAAPPAWQSSVRFLEFKPDDFSYLSAVDIVVHPSIFPDPYPNAVREAMALGKPVIGSRVGGIPDLITDGLTGILIEPDNPIMLAAALKRLINSSAERARMGEEAYRRASNTFDIHVCKEAFFEALLSVLTLRGNKSNQ